MPSSCGASLKRFFLFKFRNCDLVGSLVGDLHAFLAARAHFLLNFYCFASGLQEISGKSDSDKAELGFDLCQRLSLKLLLLLVQGPPLNFFLLQFAKVRIEDTLQDPPLLLLDLRLFKLFEEPF